MCGGRFEIVRGGARKAEAMSFARKPLGDLSKRDNAMGGINLGKQTRKKASFAESTTMISPEPGGRDYAPNPGTEERKSTYKNRTRSAGQTPFASMPKNEEKRAKDEVNTPPNTGIFGYDYGYHSAVKGSVKKNVQVYNDIDGPVQQSFDGASMPASPPLETGLSGTPRRSPTSQSPAPSVRPSRPSPPQPHISGVIEVISASNGEKLDLKSTQTVLALPPTACVKSIDSESEGISLSNDKIEVKAEELDDMDDSICTSYAEQEAEQEQEPSLNAFDERLMGVQTQTLEEEAGEEAPPGVSGSVQFADAHTSPIDVAYHAQARQSPVSTVVSPSVGVGAYRTTTVSPEEREGHVLAPRRSQKKEPSPSPTHFTTGASLMKKKMQLLPASTPSVTTAAPDVGVSMSKPRMGKRGLAGVGVEKNRGEVCPPPPVRAAADMAVPRPKGLAGRPREMARVEVSEEYFDRAAPVPSPVKHVTAAIRHNDHDEHESAHSFMDSTYPDFNDRRYSMPGWRVEQSMQSASGYSEVEDKKPVDNSMSSHSREMDDELRGLDELMESFLQRAQQDSHDFYSSHAETESKESWRSAHGQTQARTQQQSVRASAPSRLGAPGRRMYGNASDSLLDTSDSVDAVYQDPEVIRAATEVEAHVSAQDFEHELNESSVQGGSTTMSVLDSSFLQDTTGEGHGEAIIAFGSRREVEDDALSIDEDMKEVTLSCAPGSFTTLVLTFRNQRKRTMTLKSAAILVRFDRLGHFWDSNRSGDRSSLICPSGGVFQVSPRALQLDPGASANLYLTFSPSQEAQGIYGGALKIKSRGKSFVLLLRGEARSENSDLTLQDSPVPSKQQEHNSEPSPLHLHQAMERPPQNAHTLFNASASREEDTGIYAAAKEASLLKSSRSRWLQNWVRKEKGYPMGESQTRELFVQDIVYLKSANQGVLTIESKSSLIVKAKLEPSTEDISLSAYHVTIKPRSKCCITIFTKSDRAGFDLDGVPFSATKSHAGYISVTSELDDHEYIVDVRLGYTCTTPAKRATASRHATGSSTLTPQKTFLWPSITQPLGTVDRVSKTLRLETPLRELPPSSRSVFFRTNSVLFEGGLGALTRERVDLCNTTDGPIKVRLQDPDLPFVLLHSEVNVEPQSYVSIPIRFVPVADREYSSILYGKTVDGEHLFSVLLQGRPIDAI